MLLCVPEVLSKAEVARFRARLETAEWVDGAATAGEQSRLVKRNAQVREGSAAAVELGEAVLDALGRAPDFVSAALPLKTFPPLFNRYAGGDAFGAHIDNAIRPVRGTTVRVRTDLSCTLFLSEPDDYDGGELVIEGAFGAQAVKLGAGDLVLYPGTSLHQVTPVTRGARVAAFFLGAEHGARRHGAHAAVRPGPGDPRARRRAWRGPPPERAADGRLPQPRAALRRHLRRRSCGCSPTRGATQSRHPARAVSPVERQEMPMRMLMTASAALASAALVGAVAASAAAQPVKAPAKPLGKFIHPGDKNKDQRIDKAEWIAMGEAAAAFARADKNRDGKLDGPEFTAFKYPDLARLRQQR